MENISPINENFVNKELFSQLLDHDNHWVQINSANTLLEINNDTTSLNLLRKLINSNDVKIRSKAIKLIGEYGNSEDIDLLYNLINDEYVRIRVNASEALLRIIKREENKT